MNASPSRFLARLATLLVAVVFAVMAGGCATAQSQPRGWSRAELEQMLAPIALYPDPLLAQLLVASTYPDEIVVAARWSRLHPELEGEDAVRAADAFDWDPSVTSLLAFPGLIQRMDEKIDWTRELGDAFLAQEADVMDAVQALRHRARVAGALASDDHLHVIDDGPRIRIAFVSPAAVYLPYYDARVVYGSWWWPAHPPVAWAPWPGYRFVPRRPGVAIGLWWSTGVRLSIGFFYGDIDWPRRELRVARVDTWYVHRAIERRAPHRVVVIKPGRWHHEPTRRYAAHRPAQPVVQAPARTAPPRDLRRPEPQRPQARAPEPKRAAPPQPQAHRPEPRRAEPRRHEPQRAQDRAAPERRPDQPRAAARTREATPQPPRAAEARRREAPAPDAQRPQRDARRGASERPRASGPRAPRQEGAHAQQPAREANHPEPRRAAQPEPRTPEAQAPQRAPRNADSARERQPQG